MLEATERRIVRALERLTYKEVAQAWNLSDRTVLRIAKKYGVKREGFDWDVRRQAEKERRQQTA